MTFPRGPLSQYFEVTEPPSPMVSVVLRDKLLAATRWLVTHHFANTVFARGLLDLTFVWKVPTHTIFSRRDQGRAPYLLADLAEDLRKGTLSRETIDDRTEREILSLVDTIPILPDSPPPVVIEDSSARHYLILEGNKRFAAAAFVDSGTALPKLEAYVGRSRLSWRQLLSLHSMEPAA